MTQQAIVKKEIMKKIIKNRKNYLIGNIVQKCKDDIYNNDIKLMEITINLINRTDRNIEDTIKKLKKEVPCLRNISKLKNRKIPNFTVVQIKEKYWQILEICKVYKTKESKYYKDEELKKIAVNSLKFMRKNYYNKHVREHTNWWQWEIGIPLLINDIFVLIGEEAEIEMKKNLETTMYFQPDSKYSGNNPVAIHPLGNPLRNSTGGNRVDTVKISIIRAALLNDEIELKKALEDLPIVLEYKNENNDNIGDETDGFYKDGSFLQHGSIPYTGTYGNIILSGIGEIMYMLQGTLFFDELRLDNLYEIVFNSFEPFFFYGRMPDMLNGRSLTRENYSDKKTGYQIIDSLILLSQSFIGKERVKLEEIIVREIEKSNSSDYFENEKSPFFSMIAGMLLLKNKNKKFEYKKCIKVCNSMNRFFKREKDFAIGIAMHSAKIGNYETMNGENENGWFTGDGMYYFYDKNLENYTGYWKEVDWKYMPGTTEVMEDLTDKDTSRTLKENMISTKFTGSLEYENYAAATMDYLNWNEKLSSKKSWFLLDGKIVFVETEINGKGAIYTTVENRKYIEKPNVEIDGVKFNCAISRIENIKGIKTISVNNLCYKFITNSNIYFVFEEKNGDYFMRIWVEHGENPVNEALCWILEYGHRNDETVEINYNEKAHKISYKGIKFEIAIDENSREKNLIKIEEIAKKRVKTLKIEKCIHKIGDLQI